VKTLFTKKQGKVDYLMLHTKLLKKWLAPSLEGDSNFIHATVLRRIENGISSYLLLLLLYLLLIKDLANHSGCHIELGHACCCLLLYNKAGKQHYTDVSWCCSNLKFIIIIFPLLVAVGSRCFFLLALLSFFFFFFCLLSPSYFKLLLLFQLGKVA